MPHRMPRRAYAEMFGPTVGDRLRLADTDLVLQVEGDRTVYGDEVKFGGGKVIRKSTRLNSSHYRSSRMPSSA